MTENKSIKIYSVILAGPRVSNPALGIEQGLFLWLGAAPTLEQAILAGKRNLDQNGKESAVFTCAMSRFIDVPIISEKAAPIIIDKNVLMKKIVESKDTKLFFANDSIFTNAEKEFIKEKLNVKR